MRPTPIPDAEVPAGYSRRVISPPNGDLTGEIDPVEATITYDAGMPQYSVRMVLEDGDLETLTAGGTVWLTFLGHMVPFAVRVHGAI